MASPAALLDVSGSDAEQAAPATQHRVAPSSAESQGPGPRHLMLRELSEQEVLASMRDAQLTSSESVLAAQGLARALMQAGYARVQVVVNGQQHRHEAADGDGTLDFKAGSQEAVAAPTFPSTRQVRHGD